MTPRKIHGISIPKTTELLPVFYLSMRHSKPRYFRIPQGSNATSPASCPSTTPTARPYNPPARKVCGIWRISRDTSSCPDPPPRWQTPSTLAMPEQGPEKFQSILEIYPDDTSHICVFMTLKLKVVPAVRVRVLKILAVDLGH